MTSEHNNLIHSAQLSPCYAPMNNYPFRQTVAEPTGGYPLLKKTTRLAFFMGLGLLVPAVSVLPGNPGVAQAAAQLSEDDNAAVTLLNTYLNEIWNMKG